MKTRLTAAVAAIGMARLALFVAAALALAAGPVHAHNVNEDHHKIKIKACAKNKKTSNSSWSRYDNTFTVQFQYRHWNQWKDFTNSGGDWKHANGAEIHIQSNAANGGKWWCQGDAKTFTMAHWTHGDSLDYYCGDSCAARLEVTNGPDHHFDLIGKMIDDPDTKIVCVEGNYPADTDVGSWNVTVTFSTGTSC